MMNNNHNTRAFAESIGRATAFGQDIVTCDMLLNSQSCGYYYYATDEEATVVSPTDPKGAYSYWADYLREAQALAERHDQDPETYGVLMKFNHGRGCIYMYLVRVEYMKSKALDMAENDSVQCPSFIVSYGRNEENKNIRLTDEGREPYPQQDDPAGRAEVEAGRMREDAENALEMLKFAEDNGYTRVKFAEGDEYAKDDLDEWVSTNISFEE